LTARPGTIHRTATPEGRRARPTLRCLTEDLGLDIPTLDVDLGTLDHPWLDELRRTAQISPQGQKRILSIDVPLVYRLRVSADRGATWVDAERDTVWLCAVRGREQGSDDDAYEWFATLHASGRLLPSDDDRLRDDAESVVRIERALTADLFALVDSALDRRGSELTTDLGGWIPGRAMVREGDGIHEIWCSLSVRTTDGEFIRPELRDILFARLEEYLSPVIFEARGDWPTGAVPWHESVRLGLRD
jgi:hypothetical protein